MAKKKDCFGSSPEDYTCRTTNCPYMSECVIAMPKRGGILYGRRTKIVLYDKDGNLRLKVSPPFFKSRDLISRVST